MGRWGLSGVLLLAGACGSDPPAPATCAASAGPEQVEVVALAWGFVDPAGPRGVVAGLDVDGRASTRDDDVGCNQEDVRWPADAETAAVDNDLGPLVTSFDAVDANGDYATAIMVGSLRLVIELGPTDEGESCARSVTWVDGDTRVATTFFRGGPGFIEASFPDRLPFPVYVDSRRINGILQNVRIHVDTSDPSNTMAVIGGAVALDEAVRVGVELAQDPMYESLVRSLVTGEADLAPDRSGTCQGISAGWLLQGPLTAVTP